jgi:type VI protein secretion system component VasK
MHFSNGRFHAGETTMSRLIIIAFTIPMLAACGAETATTAATVGAVKKQELEQGRQTMEQVQQKVGESMQQMQQAPARAAD